jgi:rod shape-determining protein MreD
VIEMRTGVRPRPTLGRRLDQLARGFFPSAVTLIVILVLEAPLGLRWAPQLQAAATLVSLFFWSVHRPLSMPPWAGFALGLLIDLLQLQPIGLSSLAFVIVIWVARRWRHDILRHGRVLGWVSFALTALGCEFGIYAGTCILQLRILPPSPSVVTLVLALTLYPLLSLLLSRAHQSAAAPEQA